MRRLWKNKPLLFAWVAVILFVVLTAFTLGERSAGRVENLFGNAALSVQETVNGITHAVTDFFVRVFTPSSIQEENARLRKQITEYERALALYEETERENARLTELLNFANNNGDMSFLAGRVIAKSTNPYVDSITLNVGARQGVEEKMAVICPYGIVGRVVEVGSTWCKVRTMQNDDMRISVMVSRTRDEGMAGGLIENGGTLVGLQLYYLPAGAELEAGDEIVTSGLGGIFPKGLYVGTVLSVSSGSTSYDACIRTEVDFAHLEEVIVVLGVDEVAGG